MELGVVDGFNLIVQRWSSLMGGNGVSGTIRTVPQNYYVATIEKDGTIKFEDFEANTRDITRREVKKLYKNVAQFN